MTKFGLRLGSLLAIVILFLLSITIWLTTSTNGARTVFSVLEHLSDGELHVTEINGRLFGKLSLGRLVIKNQQTIFDAENIELEWNASELTAGILHITRLQAASLRIKLEGNADELPKIPASLSFPLRLQIDSLNLAHTYVEQEKNNILLLDDIAIRIDFDGQFYAIKLNKLLLYSPEVPELYVQLLGNIVLHAAKPYATEAKLNLHILKKTNGKGENIVSSLFNVNGNLINLQTTFQINIAHEKFQTAAQGTINIQPYSKNIFASSAIYLSDLDLQSLNKNLQHTRIHTEIKIDQQGHGQFFIKNLLPGTLNNDRLPIYSGEGEFKFLRDKIQILDSKMNEGIINIKGEFSTKHGNVMLITNGLDLKKIDSRLTKTQLFANLDGAWRMKPVPEISVNYQIRKSSVNGHALSGRGKFMLTEKKLQIDALDLIAGDNSMHVQGLADKNTSKLQLAIKARDLSQLGMGFQGSAQISANIAGTTDKPFIDMTWRAHHLALAGKMHIEKTVGKAKFHLVRDSSFLITQCDAQFFAENIRSGKNLAQFINFNANINVGENSILDLQFLAKNISYATVEIKSIRTEFMGKIDDHKIITHVNTEKENIELEVNGKFKDINSLQTWHGILKKADGIGQIKAKLRNDVIMVVSKEFSKIESISLDTNFGNFFIEFIKRDRQLSASKGNLRNLDILKFLKIIHAKDLSDKTNLLMDGDWDIEINENLTAPIKATINLKRTQGDIVIPGEQPLALGLEKLNMECKSDKDHLTGKFEAEGVNLGLLRLQVETIFNKENKFPDLNAPINATLDINMPSIAWTSKMISSNLILDGSMQSKIILSGSLQKPNFNGSINGNKLNLLLIDSGISLKEGYLNSEFSGNTININQLKFLGSSGFILATGPITIEKNKIQTNLLWHADKLTVFDSPDRKLIVSGSGKFSAVENQLNIQGDLLVDQGVFDIGRADTPKLTDDVIILGHEDITTQFPKLNLDIGIGLGQQLVLRGRGLDARMGGALRVQSNKDRPISVYGLMQSIKGTYQAYGRMLSIERGILRFDGQPGNPALDIRAIQRGTEVEAGVAIGGNAMAPRISLVSEPPVPDAEKLSWLVLGQGLFSASGTQAVELQSAAGSLLTERAAAGLQSQIANALGIDSISIAKSQDTLQDRIVTLGKRVSSRLYVSYQQGLHTASSLLLFRYTLSPRVTLETETGNRSVFSLFYNINYD